MVAAAGVCLNSARAGRVPGRRQDEVAARGGEGNEMNGRSMMMAWALLVVGLGGAGCTESFDLTFNYQAAQTPAVALRVDNLQGSVRLKKGAVGSAISGRVKVHAAGFDKESQAKAAAEAVEVVENMNGDELVLSVGLPASGRSKTFDVTFDLSVPENLSVAVVTDNGRVSIDGLAVTEVDTTNGPVDLVFTAAVGDDETTVRTQNGAVSVDAHEGAIDVLTTNAVIDIFDVAGDARASTTNAPITARVIPPPGGEVILSTTNAPIDLALPRDFGARLIAVTSSPGVIAISSDLRFTPTGGFPGQAEGVLGDGAGRVDVRTTLEDVFIHR